MMVFAMFSLGEYGTKKFRYIIYFKEQFIFIQRHDKISKYIVPIS